MSLIFAALVPHPPVLIPEIGKEHLSKLEKTKSAMEQVEQDLYSAKPDVIMVISPHGEIDKTAFTVNLANEYEADFEAFGDFSTKIKFKGDTILMTAGKEKISAKSPLNIISESRLDHGSAVPLYFLAQHLPNVPVIPIYFSMLDSQAHFEFGKGLKELIMSSDKRVAVIASGDLSHCLTEEAPMACNPLGKQFDEKIIKLVESCDSLGIVNFDHELAEAAAECGLRSIQILAGVLSDMKCQPKVLSYEHPFGIGYAVIEINLS